MNGKDGATSRRQSSRGALVISEVLQKWAIVGVDAPHDASPATKHRTTLKPVRRPMHFGVNSRTLAWGQMPS